MELKLKKIFIRIFKKKAVLKSSSKKISSWDSLKHLDLIFALEEEFNIKFTNKEIMSIKNYKICLKILKKKLK
tara:strand:+ start:1870 stop:2088 length:219 start_codon:yes stop_codon:yes gene_type:complete